MLADGDYLSLSLFLFLYYSLIVEAVAIFFVDKIEKLKIRTKVFCTKVLYSDFNFYKFYQ